MDKVRYVINEVCRTWNQPPVFRAVRETFSVTCTKHPSIANVREFFKTVFQGQYDIGEAGMRYFTIGFVSTMQVNNKHKRGGEGGGGEFRSAKVKLDCKKGGGEGGGVREVGGTT